MYTLCIHTMAWSLLYWLDSKTNKKKKSTPIRVSDEMCEDISWVCVFRQKVNVLGPILCFICSAILTLYCVYLYRYILYTVRTEYTHIDGIFHIFRFGKKREKNIMFTNIEYTWYGEPNSVQWAQNRKQMWSLSSLTCFRENYYYFKFIHSELVADRTKVSVSSHKPSKNDMRKKLHGQRRQYTNERRRVERTTVYRFDCFTLTRPAARERGRGKSEGNLSRNLSEPEFK